MQRPPTGWEPWLHKDSFVCRTLDYQPQNSCEYGFLFLYDVKIVQKEKKVFDVKLTALDRMRGHLERDVLPSRLRYVHTKHKTNAGVFPTDVSLALPQLDVGVPELQDPSTVDSVRRDKCLRKWKNV